MAKKQKKGTKDRPIILRGNPSAIMIQIQLDTKNSGKKGKVFNTPIGDVWGYVRENGNRTYVLNGKPIAASHLNNIMQGTDVANIGKEYERTSLLLSQGQLNHKYQINSLKSAFEFCKIGKKKQKKKLIKQFKSEKATGEDIRANITKIIGTILAKDLFRIFEYMDRRQ